MDECRDTGVMGWFEVLREYYCCEWSGEHVELNISIRRQRQMCIRDGVTIGLTNLPEHEHDLVVEGTQFYAILDAAKGAESPASSITYDAPTGSGQGQAVSTSGGVAGSTGTAIDTMNPFMSMNYIIYTGNI